MHEHGGVNLAIDSQAAVSMLMRALWLRLKNFEQQRVTKHADRRRRKQTRGGAYPMIPPSNILERASMGKMLRHLEMRGLCEIELEQRGRERERERE